MRILGDMADGEYLTANHLRLNLRLGDGSDDDL